MLKTSLKRTGGSSLLKKLTKRLKDFDGAYVNAGYFDSQGEHSYAGMSYVDLMKLHEYGDPGLNIPSRPAMTRTATLVQRRLGRISKDPLRDYIFTRKSLNQMMDAIGSEVVKSSQEVFGSEKYLLVTHNPTPLVDTEDLARSFSWMTSKRPTLKSLDFTFVGN